MMKKFAVVLMMMPLVALADMVSYSPAWDEVVWASRPIPWTYVGLLCALAIFTIVGLIFWHGRRRKVPMWQMILLSVIYAVLVSVSITTLFWRLNRSERVIHHPARSVRPPTHCSRCGTALKYDCGRYCPECHPRPVECHPRPVSIGQ